MRRVEVKRGVEGEVRKRGEKWGGEGRSGEERREVGMEM